jgi:hypothetical protein
MIKNCKKNMECEELVRSALWYYHRTFWRHLTGPLQIRRVDMTEKIKIDCILNSDSPGFKKNPITKLYS